MFFPPGQEFGWLEPFLVSQVPEWYSESPTSLPCTLILLLSFLTQTLLTIYHGQASVLFLQAPVNWGTRLRISGGKFYGVKTSALALRGV